MSPEGTHLRNGGETSAAVPVAVVGLGCRLAGSATNPDALWQMLSRGKSGWTRGAGTRFNLAAFHHPSAEMNGTFNAQGIHLLKQDISQFDNQMFNVSAIEAKAIDPQQRLLLEVAYEAFENAGIPRESLRSSETGVYAAVFNHDYESIQARDPEISPSYRFTGTGPALVSNRISYVFDLRGPSVTIDTACSGSLVAMHQACQAIRIGEIRQALVGGTNLILDPEYMTAMSSMQVLSDHGRCYSFDSRATGFGRGEGVAAIVLKRLDDALRDGDPIRAIIRATATNQDGRTPGVTVPSHDAQVQVIKKAYAQAGLDPRDTCYVEAHGTGTKVGDKTEAGAVAETFACERTESSPLYVGSVKTNVGHTESTAGLAGLLKAILILERGIIPPNLNFSTANEAISLEKWHIQIPQKLIPWPANQVRRASVNSFGYGGSNAHIILDGAEGYLSCYNLLHHNKIHYGAGHVTHSRLGTTLEQTNITTIGNYDQCPKKVRAFMETDKRAQNDSYITNGEFSSGSDSSVDEQGRRRLFLLTHDTDKGIGKLAIELKRYIQEHDVEKMGLLGSFAHTLTSRRSKLAFRVAVTAVDQEELSSILNDIAKGTIRPVRAVEVPKICFAFTGQGAQWAGMGKELISAYPVFANALAIAERHLASIGADWSLLDELNQPVEHSRINEARLSQPCCTAIQIALVDLFRSWHIRPDVVFGHSSGEIAAAYAAGFLTAGDALSIAFHRGEAVSRLRSVSPHLKGGMLAVALSVEEVHRYIRHDSLGDGLEKVVVACINSPSSVTLSGDLSPLRDIQHRLQADQVFNRMLVVDVAYHSHHMELVREHYLSSMKDLKPCTVTHGVRMISSLTGQPISPRDLNADYWAQNMVCCVRFAAALEKAVQLPGAAGTQSTSSVDTVVEIGPHSALAGPINQSLKAIATKTSKVSYHSAISRNQDGVKSATELAGQLACYGLKVNFDAVNDPLNNLHRVTLSDLPTYNWTHAVSHWNEGRASSQYRFRQFPRHDLLGVACNDSISLEPKWRNYIRVKEMPWVQGHVFQGQVIFPASGYICAALEAIRQVTLSSGRMWKGMVCRFRQISCVNALLVPEDATGIETMLSLRPCIYSARESSLSWKEFRIFSISAAGEAIEHCRGLVSAEQRCIDDSVVGQRENKYSIASISEMFELAKKEYRQSVSPKRFYKGLKFLGTDYSGPFANITKISAGSRGALCEISVPETKSSMPGMFEQPHCLHPATLDMCFQAPFAGLRASGDMKTTLLITHIEELDVSSDISATPGSTLLACVSAEPFGATKYEARVAVAEVTDLNRHPLIDVKGLVYTSAIGLSLEASRGQEKHLCHQIKWFTDIFCAKTQDILRLCDDRLPESSATMRRDVYDTYAQGVIQTVLSALSTEEEAQIEEHHKKLLGWMRAHQSQSLTDGKNYTREMVQSLGVDGKMLVHVGDHMLDILQGKVDALTILLEEDLLYQVYSNENTHRCHAQLDQYLRLLGLKNPNMDILEIGAGTAGTTVPVLEAFSTWSDGLLKKTSIHNYVFSDISSGFFEKSKEKLQSWQDILEFKKLDIEGDVQKQGFNDGTFDLIIASNVLHATQKIFDTLQNVRRLLKPGGKLILVEITEPHMTWPMIVGTLPGWWLGAEDGRVESPSLTSDGWDDVLRLTNFSGVDIEMMDYKSAYEHQLSVLISTATPESYFTSYPPINVVCSKTDNSLADEFCNLLALTNPDASVRRTSLDEFDGSEGVYVVLVEATSPLISHCSSEAFENVKQMLTRAKNILWVTKGATIDCIEPERAMITGLARTARSEDHLLNLVTLDLDPCENSLFESASHVKTVLDDVFCSKRDKTFLTEFEYSVRSGVVLIPRIVVDESLDDYMDNTLAEKVLVAQALHQVGRSLDLRIETPGLLETLYWADSATHSRMPGPEEVRIKVEAVPLNFKDLMTGMGQLDGLTAILIECSGVVEQVGDMVGDRFQVGDRVCAVGYKSIATTSNVDYRLVQHIPECLPSEVAAALQISYATALYALRDVARIQKGESILIHSAAGAFGQAAIALAKYMGVGQIYVTAGNAEKKAFLAEKFGIPEAHIFSSRTVLFREGILRLTKMKGVDVILNSLSGELMFETYKCLARFGRFVEIGKKDLLSNTRLEMQHFEQNVTFSTVDLSMLMEFKPDSIQELLGTVFDIVRDQKVQLLSPIITKNVSELEPTFRLMQTGKHIGKMVMILDDETEVKVERPRFPPPKLKEDRSYLIIGGTGGLGKAIIRHLSKIGARHIIALSRSGASDDNTVGLIEECRSAGVDLIIHKGSVLNVSDIQETVALAGQRQICGVIQGAMVLKDSTLSNMSYEKWQAAVLPKVQGTLNLHAVFKDSLDFFILLSSGTGIIGSYGQGNYSAGNTFQDAFARWRTTCSLPARTIDLGPVEGEGYAAENENALEFTLRQGMGVVKLEEVMALMDHAITYPRAKDVASSQNLVATRRADPTSGSDEAAVQRPDPKFAHLWAASSREHLATTNSGEFDFRKELHSAATRGSAAEAAETAIINKLSKLLAISVEDVHPERAVGAYGMDSLISVELRNWMAVQLEASIQQFELMAAKSIHDLAAMVAERSRLVPVSVFTASN